MNGLFGLHIEGNTGAGREEPTAYANRLRGAYATVVNDPEQARLLMALGVTVFYRVKTDDWNDDHAHLNIHNPAAFARHLHEQAPAGAVLYSCNEPGNGDLVKLNDWHIAFIDEAERLGRKVIAFNFSFGTPEHEDWDALAPAMRRLVDGGHWIGVHEGFTGEHKGGYPVYDGDKLVDVRPKYELAYPWLVGRFLPIKQKFGGKWAVTEITSSAGAHNGWRDIPLTEGEYADQLAFAAKLYAQHGVPATIFTYHSWKSGFAFSDALSLKERLITMNQQYVLEEEKPVAQIVNMQDHVCPVDGALYHLNSGETMQCGYDASGYGRQYKNALWEEMWVRTINGVQYLMRGMDISQYPAASGGKVYGLFADNTLAEYGTAWCPVNFEVGKVYRRRVWVQWFNAQTGAKIAQGSGWDETYFKIVKYHDTWTTFEGVQVTGVAECVYGHMPDLSNVKERYYYAKRRGLVGFIDYNLNPPKQTVITREQPTSRPAPVSLSWWERPPLEKPTVPTYPDPTTLGDPINGVITATAANIANVRAAPTTKVNNVVATVKTGDAVVYRPTPFANEGYLWTWLVSHSGWVSNVATIDEPPKPVEPLIIDLPAPYVSQTDADADKYNNDCMIAVLLMLTRTWFVRKGLRAPLIPTVDDLAPYTPLPAKDPQKLGLNFADIAALGLLTGFEVEYVRPLTPDKIVRYLDEGKVVGALVTENKVNPNGKAIAHAVAVKGYGETTFSLHDPNNTEDYRIDRAQLETAMTGVPGNLFDAQGFVLKAA